MVDVLRYREVRQRFSVRDDDGADADLHPDRHTVTGVVEFVPRLPRGDVLAYPEEFIKPLPITGRIVDGELFANWVESDQEAPRPLYLPVTVDDRADQKWSWIMRVTYMYVDGIQTEVKMGDRDFQVEDGDGPLWLSEVSGTYVKGTITTRGAAGPGLHSITAQNGNLVFSWDYGHEDTVIPVPDAVPGPPGDTGDVGPPPYLATGVTTVTDDPAEAALVIRGATPNYRVDAVIPRGPRGDRGDGVAPVTIASTPEYTSASAHTWEESLSLYNGDSEAMRVIRSMVRRGLRGERVRMVCAGPSTVAGTGGAQPMVAVSSWPAQLIDLLGARPGRVMASQYDNRWTLGTGIAGRTATNTLGASSSATFTASYTGLEAATGYTLYAYRQTETQLTITVDGGTPQSVYLPGTSGFKPLRIDGLADTPHTITIQGPASVFLDSIEADSEGLTVHNAGRPSSSAADWVSANTTSTWSQVFPTTFAAEERNSEQVPPDLALIQPLLNGSAASDIRQVVANVRQLEIPAVLVTCGGVGSMTGGSAVPAQIAALYAAADEFDLPLIDLTDTMGWYASANAKGLMADTVHPNRRGYSVQAWRIYKALIGA